MRPSSILRVFTFVTIACFSFISIQSSARQMSFVDLDDRPSSSSLVERNVADHVDSFPLQVIRERIFDGNDNRLVSGESFELEITVRNTANYTISFYDIELSSADPNLLINGQEGVQGSLQAGESRVIRFCTGGASCQVSASANPGILGFRYTLFQSGGEGFGTRVVNRFLRVWDPSDFNPSPVSLLSTQYRDGGNEYPEVAELSDGANTESLEFRMRNVSSLPLLINGVIAFLIPEGSQTQIPLVAQAASSTVGIFGVYEGVVELLPQQSHTWTEGAHQIKLIVQLPGQTPNFREILLPFTVYAPGSGPVTGVAINEFHYSDGAENYAEPNDFLSVNQDAFDFAIENVEENDLQIDVMSLKIRHFGQGLAQTLDFLFNIPLPRNQSRVVSFDGYPGFWPVGTHELIVTTQFLDAGIPRTTEQSFDLTVYANDQVPQDTGVRALTSSFRYRDNVEQIAYNGGDDTRYQLIEVEDDPNLSQMLIGGLNHFEENLTNLRIYLDSVDLETGGTLEVTQEVQGNATVQFPQYSEFEFDQGVLSNLENGGVLPVGDHRVNFRFVFDDPNWEETDRTMVSGVDIRVRSEDFEWLRADSFEWLGDPNVADTNWRIHLSFFRTIFDVTLHEMRHYGENGQLVRTITYPHSGSQSIVMEGFPDGNLYYNWSGDGGPNTGVSFRGSPCLNIHQSCSRQEFDDGPGRVEIDLELTLDFENHSITQTLVKEFDFSN